MKVALKATWKLHSEEIRRLGAHLDPFRMNSNRSRLWTTLISWPSGKPSLFHLTDSGKDALELTS